MQRLSRTLLSRNVLSRGRRALSGEKITIRDTDPNRLDKMEFYLKSISNDTARKLEVMKDIHIDVKASGTWMIGLLTGILTVTLLGKK